MGILDRLAGQSGTVTLVLVAGVSAAVLVSSYQAWARLRHIPGPRGAGWSKWWMLRNTLSGKMHLALKQACDDFGPVARIGPNDLVTNDVELVRQLFAVRSPYRKGPFYQAVRFDPTRDNLISMRDDEAHSELRAKVAAAYSGKENESLEATIDEVILEFVQFLEAKYLSTKMDYRPVDIARKVQYLTLDIITSLAFNRKFGYIESDTDVHDYIQMTEDSMPVMMFLTVFPWLAKILQSPVGRKLMPSEHDRVGFGKFIRVAKDVVEERAKLMESNQPMKRDMLNSFLNHGLTREEAAGESLVQVIAGSDTTATAIRSTLLYLLSNPTVYTTLATEIRTAVRDGRISSPIVKDSQAKMLPYLQAVIREGLRIFPPVTGIMSVTVPQPGEMMHGYKIPGGTDIGWSIVGIMRDKAVFGEDADIFRPERWLEAEEEQMKVMAAQVEMVFKYGKWQCLGKSIAQMELNKIFVELLRRFDFAGVNPTQPWSSYSAGIFIQHDFWVTITPAPITA